MFAYIRSYFTSIWDTIFGSLFDGLLLSSSSNKNSSRKGRLLVLGLDNAGKTTLLQAIRNHHMNSSNSGNSNNNNNSSSSTPQQQQQQRQQQQRLYPPTDRPQYIKDIIQINHQISFHAYDLGGHEAVRHLWSDYYHMNDTTTTTVSDTDEPTEESTASSSTTTTMNLAILFCIDIADIERMEEASYELDALIHDLISSHGNSENENDITNDDDTNNTNTNTNTNTNPHRHIGIPIAILLTKYDTMHEHIQNRQQLLSIEDVQNKIDYHTLQMQYNNNNNNNNNNATSMMKIFPVSVYEQYGYMDALQWITKQLTTRYSNHR